MRGDGDLIDKPLCDGPRLVVVCEGVVARLDAAKGCRGNVGVYVGGGSAGVTGNGNEGGVVGKDLLIADGRAVRAERCHHRMQVAVVLIAETAKIGRESSEHPAERHALGRDRPRRRTCGDGVVCVAHRICGDACGAVFTDVRPTVRRRIGRSGTDGEVGAGSIHLGDGDRHAVGGNNVADRQGDALSACGINVSKTRNVIAVTFILPSNGQGTRRDGATRDCGRIDVGQGVCRSEGIVAVAADGDRDGLARAGVVNVGFGTALCGVRRGNGQAVGTKHRALVEINVRRTSLVVMLGGSQRPIRGDESLGIDGPRLRAAVVVLRAGIIGLRGKIRTRVCGNVAGQGGRHAHRGDAVAVVVTKFGDRAVILGGGDGMIRSGIGRGQQRGAVQTIREVRDLLADGGPTCGGGIPSVVAAVPCRNADGRSARSAVCGSLIDGEEVHRAVCRVDDGDGGTEGCADGKAFRLDRIAGDHSVQDVTVGQRGRNGRAVVFHTRDRQFDTLINAVCKGGVDRRRRLIGVCRIVCIVACKREVGKVGIGGEVGAKGRRKGQRDLQPVDRESKRRSRNRIIGAHVARRDIVGIRACGSCREGLRLFIRDAGGRRGGDVAAGARAGTRPRDRDGIARNDVGEDEGGGISGVVIGKGLAVVDKPDGDRTASDAPRRAGGGRFGIVIIVGSQRAGRRCEAGDFGVVIRRRILGRRAA